MKRFLLGLYDTIVPWRFWDDSHWRVSRKWLAVTAFFALMRHTPEDCEWLTANVGQWAAIVWFFGLLLVAACLAESVWKGEMRP